MSKENTDAFASLNNYAREVDFKSEDGVLKINPKQEFLSKEDLISLLKRMETVEKFYDNPVGRSCLKRMYVGVSA